MLVVSHQLNLVARFADHVVLEDRGEIASELPCTEERGPVDAGAQVSEVPAVKHMQAGLVRRRGHVAHIGCKSIGAGVFQAQQFALPFADADLADVFVFVGGGLDERQRLGV